MKEIISGICSLTRVIVVGGDTCCLGGRLLMSYTQLGEIRKEFSFVMRCEFFHVLFFLYGSINNLIINISDAHHVPDIDSKVILQNAMDNVYVNIISNDKSEMNEN